MILFDLNDSGGMENWSIARGEAEGDRPDRPESLESNSIPVTPGITHYLFYYISKMVILS